MITWSSLWGFVAQCFVSYSELWTERQTFSFHLLWSYHCHLHYQPDDILWRMPCRCLRLTVMLTGSRWNGRPSEPSMWRPRTSLDAALGQPESHQRLLPVEASCGPLLLAFPPRLSPPLSAGLNYNISASSAGLLRTWVRHHLKCHELSLPPAYVRRMTNKERNQSNIHYIVYTIYVIHGYNVGFSSFYIHVFDAQTFEYLNILFIYKITTSYIKILNDRWMTEPNSKYHHASKVFRIQWCMRFLSSYTKNNQHIQIPHKSSFLPSQRLARVISERSFRLATEGNVQTK